MDRRGFVKTALGLAGTLLVAPPTVPSCVPDEHGVHACGIHDDADAIQRIIDQRIPYVGNPERPILLGRSITFPYDAPIQNCYFVFSDDFKPGPAF